MPYEDTLPEGLCRLICWVHSCGPTSTAADSTGNAAAARKAQAKARQAAMMARMKQQQALFKYTGSEGNAVNAHTNKVIWS